MENIDDWITAGKIASTARTYGYKLLKEDASIKDIINKVEEFIKEKGAELAFPTQISINNIAAHYTSDTDDTSTLKSGDLVKLDLGAHINGAISDTAITKEISTNKHEQLIQASQNALNIAIKLAIPGTKLKDIGIAIKEEITKLGFQPIENLSGHQIDIYNLHAGVSIPNFDNNDDTELEEGMIIAIEPFATTGQGLVKEGKPSTIYKLQSNRNPSTPTARKVLNHLIKHYKTLPFSKRDLAKQFNKLTILMALNTLEKQGIIYQYPQLPELTNGLVSQTEHTIIVKKQPIVTTL